MEATRAREPIFNLPGVVLLLIASFVAIHAAREWLLTFDEDGDLLALMAFVPGRLTFQFDPQGITDALSRLSGRDGSLALAQFFLGAGEPRYWATVTYAFLHGDWLHVTVNSVWLAAFGSPVARRFGGLRFLLFFAVTAIAGALAHLLTHSLDLVPMVGASAAVSGAMGAAVRFVFHPDAPLGSSVGFASRGDESVYHLPALPLRYVFRDRRVVMFVAVWFVVNFAFGLLSGPLHITDATIAWEAHVGGFLGGLLLFGLFDHSGRRPDYRARRSFG
jgi:membrane associated rhomboid family serine protease